MTNVYAIIGDANTGKSSVSRCLTGLSRSGLQDIRMINGNIIQVYVNFNAQQENKNNLIHPNHLQVNYGSYQNILILIRINPYKGLPGYQSYIAQIQNVLAWPIHGMFVFHTTPLPGWTHGHINTRPRIPLNEMASTVRQQWGWV